VENHRTSFNELLSLASVFNGDVRRALLCLQVRLQTGSTSSEKMAEPIFGPNVVTATVTTLPADIEDGTQSQPSAAVSTKSLSSCQVERDSGDEFVVVRRRKRRALRVASSDDDSQSLPASLLEVADNSGHQGCSDSSPVVADINSQQGCIDATANDCEYRLPNFPDLVIFCTIV